MTCPTTNMEPPHPLLVSKAIEHLERPRAKHDWHRYLEEIGPWRALKLADEMRNGVTRNGHSAIALVSVDHYEPDKLEFQLIGTEPMPLIYALLPIRVGENRHTSKILATLYEWTKRWLEGDMP